MELQKIGKKVFAGGLWDEDTKLIRFGVRDYDPEVGRWTSKEPLGFKGSRNFYVYAGNDSVNFVDLDGVRYTDYGGQDGHSGYEPNWWTFGENLRKDFIIIKKFLSQFLLGVFRRLGIFITLSLDMTMDSCSKKDHCLRDEPCRNHRMPINQMNKEIITRVKGTEGMTRADNAHNIIIGLAHVHFCKGFRALNCDGTWHDKGKKIPKITNKNRKWLKKWKWKLPSN